MRQSGSKPHSYCGCQVQEFRFSNGGVGEEKKSYQWGEHVFHLPILEAD